MYYLLSDFHRGLVGDGNYLGWAAAAGKRWGAINQRETNKWLPVHCVLGKCLQWRELYSGAAGQSKGPLIQTLAMGIPQGFGGHGLAMLCSCSGARRQMTSVEEVHLQLKTVTTIPDRTRPCFGCDRQPCCRAVQALESGANPRQFGWLFCWDCPSWLCQSRHGISVTRAHGSIRWHTGSPHNRGQPNRRQHWALHNRRSKKQGPKRRIQVRGLQRAHARYNPRPHTLPFFEPGE